VAVAVAGAGWKPVRLTATRVTSVRIMAVSLVLRVPGIDAELALGERLWR